MWNQTLKQIDYAHTPQNAAALWNADADSVRLVNDGINLVYRFECENKGKYLRITHAKIRSEVELAAAIDYQNYLFEHGVAVCQPIKSKFNNYIEAIEQVDQIYLAHVADEVPGKVLHFNYEDRFVYESWGKALANLHAVAKNYQPSAKFQFKSWRDIWHEIGCYAKNDEDAIKQEYQAIDIWFKKLKQHPNNFGLTHGDHRPENVLFNGQKIYIIDFDEPIYHWFIADIARPFLNLSETDFSVWRHKFNWFIDGYRSILPIDDNEIKIFFWFIRMKNIDIYLWTKKNWQDSSAPGGGSTEKWLEELRQMVINPNLG